MSLLLGWGAYAWDKNTSARLCAKNAGGEGEAYLWDTMVNSLPSPSYTAGHEPSEHSSLTPLLPRVLPSLPMWYHNLR